MDKTEQMHQAVGHLNEILKANVTDSDVHAYYTVMTHELLSTFSDFTQHFERLAVGDEYIIFVVNDKPIYFVNVSGDSVLMALSEAIRLASYKF